MSPNMAFASVERPLPTRPARPTISPAPISKPMFESLCAVERPETESAGAPALGASATLLGGSALMRDGTSSPSARTRHERGDMGDRGLAGKQRPDQAPVLDDRDPVGKTQHVRHAMADIDNADAGGLELVHDREQRLLLAHRERRGRLVHDQKLRAPGKRLQDLHHLALRKTEIADARAAASSSNP